MSNPLRLGIIGCGYVTRMSHLPAAALVPEIQVAALADPDLTRARELAAEFHVPAVAADYQEILGAVDAVIVATPHDTHAAVTIACLEAGRHVLCEKPMALSTAECDAMLAAGEENERVLAVGQVRRFSPSSQMMHQAIRRCWLGRPLQFEAEESVQFDRFPAGLFAIRPPAGGVLRDTGPHTLDLLAWWFPGLTVESYRDDNYGGVEANAELVLRAEGIQGTVCLSRTRRLANTIRVLFEEGEILYPTVAATGLQIKRAPSAPGAEPSVLKPPEVSPFALQLTDFVTAIRNQRPPLVGGVEGRQAVELIEQCLAIREPLPFESWEELVLLQEESGAHA